MDMNTKKRRQNNMAEDKKIEQAYVGKEFKLLKLDGTGEIAEDNNDAVQIPNVMFVEKVRANGASESMKFGE